MSRIILITVSMLLTVGCGVGTNPSRAPSTSQALTGTAEWLEFEPAPVRVELFREVARQSSLEAGTRGAVLFPLLVNGEFIAAPALEAGADLLGPGDAGAPLLLTFETRGDRFADDRRDAYQGLSEREAAEQIARSLITLWNLRPSGAVTVVRTPGRPLRRRVDRRPAAVEPGLRVHGRRADPLTFPPARATRGACLTPG